MGDQVYITINQPQLRLQKRTQQRNMYIVIE